MTAPDRQADKPTVAAEDIREHRSFGAALEITGSVEIRSVLDTLGRTEDLVVARSGDLIAIAAFHTNTVAFLRVSVESNASSRALQVLAVHLLRSNDLHEPHGVDIAHDHALLVANRAGELVAFRLPEVDNGVSSSTADGHVVAGRDDPVPVSSPGSVRTTVLDGGLIEALVCDNYTHRVVRYVVDPADDFAVLDAEDLLGDRLQIPDGLAVSPCGRWLAISNHASHEVFLYRFDDELGPTAEPAGTLWGANYPHGLQFTADGRHLIVADAGLPYLHSFAAPDGDWSGRREAHHHLRVMDDDEFHRGRYNPQEGGPKGLTIWDDGGLVLVTVETAAVRAFELADALGVDGLVSSLAPPAERSRDTTPAPPLRRTITRLREVEAELVATERARDEARSRAAETTAQLARLGSIETELAAQAAALDRLRGVETQLCDAETRLADAATRVADAERRLADAETRIAEADEAARSANEAVRRADASAAASAHEVGLLRDSTSWRVTRPLRAAADTFKGRRA